jgi:hypothetical protein
VLQAVAERVEPDAACCAIRLGILATPVTVLYIFCGGEAACRASLRTPFRLRHAGTVRLVHVHMDQVWGAAELGSTQLDNRG